MRLKLNAFGSFIRPPTIYVLAAIKTGAAAIGLTTYKTKAKESK